MSASKVVVLDLSRKYIERKDVKQEIENLDKGFPLYHVVKLDEAVLMDDSDGMMLDLQVLLEKLGPSLQELELNQCSKLSGRIFYRGVETVVQNPLEEHVSVEADTNPPELNGARMGSYSDVAAQNNLHVRDDKPPLEHTTKDGQACRYIRTVYSPTRRVFIRQYVLKNWLPKLRNVDLSRTDISGYGLTALVAAAASCLQRINLSGCRNIDDRGIINLVTMCQDLKYLTLRDDCSVTMHGLLYLAEMDRDKLAKMQLIDICSLRFGLSDARALFAALSDRGYQGALRFLQDGKAVEFGPTRGFEYGFFEKKLNEHRNPVFDLPEHQNQVFDLRELRNQVLDLHITDITQQTLKHSARFPDLYELDLCNRLVNDSIVVPLLANWGRRLSVLKLSGTYITHRALEALKWCKNLRSLHLARCRNIIDKAQANESAMTAIELMEHLTELDVSYTRVSGRMLSQHPNLRLVTLAAARCPISIHALRMLAENCNSTLHHLMLPGCNFVNTKSMYFLAQLRDLRVLDLSYCPGLTPDGLRELVRQAKEKHTFRHLSYLDIRGVRGAGEALAEELTRILGGRTVVVWAEGDTRAENAVGCLRDRGFPASTSAYSFDTFRGPLNAGAPYGQLPPARQDGGGHFGTNGGHFGNGSVPPPRRQSGELGMADAGYSPFKSTQTLGNGAVGQSGKGAGPAPGYMVNGNMFPDSKNVSGKNKLQAPNSLLRAKTSSPGWPSSEAAEGQYAPFVSGLAADHFSSPSSSSSSSSSSSFSSHHLPLPQQQPSMSPAHTSASDSTGTPSRRGSSSLSSSQRRFSHRASSPHLDEVSQFLQDSYMHTWPPPRSQAVRPTGAASHRSPVSYAPFGHNDVVKFTATAKFPGTLFQKPQPTLAATLSSPALPSAAPPTSDMPLQSPHGQTSWTAGMVQAGRGDDMRRIVRGDSFARMIDEKDQRTSRTRSRSHSPHNGLLLRNQASQASQAGAAGAGGAGPPGGPAGGGGGTRHDYEHSDGTRDDLAYHVHSTMDFQPGQS